MKIRIAAVLTASAVIAALLSACTPTTSVVTGSEVRVAVASPLTSLNPSTSYGRSTVTNADVAYLTSASFGYVDDRYAWVPDTSFGTASIVDDDPLTVKYAVARDARWSDGVAVDAADLLLAWAANSGSLNTRGDDGAPFDDRDYVDPETGRYTDDFPDDIVFFDGSVGGGLDRASRIPEISDDGRSLIVRYDTYFSGWRSALQPGLPAHVVARQALDLDDDDATDNATADEAKAALVRAVADGEAGTLGAVARVWNSGYNLTETPDDGGLLVSSGPYSVSEVNAESVTLSANPEYRGDRTPGFETVVLAVSPDPLEAVDLLETGAVDIVSPQPSADVVSALLSIDGITVIAGSEGTFEHLDLQFTGSRSGTFDDRRVREAFLHVVPRQQILDELVAPVQQEASLLDSFVLRPGADGYDDTVAENGSREYSGTDVDEAVSLLADAGVTSPVVCILFDPANPRRVAEFQAIQTSAGRVGFQVTDCSTPDWDDLLGVAGAYDAALYAWDTTRLGASATAAVFRSDAELANFSGYSSPAVDALIAELDATDDESEQVALLTEIDALVWGDAYGVPLFAYPTVTGVSSAISGVTRSPLARSVFWNAWGWKPAVQTPEGSDE